MWYFQFNNQQNGPNDSEVIKALLTKRTLNGHTLVWKEGMPDWRRLADTELAPLIPTCLPPPINAPAVQKATVQPPPIQPARTPPPVDQSGPTQAADNQSDSLFPEFFETPRGIHCIWLWSVILIGAGVCFLIYGALVCGSANQSYNGYDGDFQMPLFLGAIIVAGGAILWWVLLFKSWKVIQDGNPTTTPGKAVGFMFIPVFNYYWQFIAILGLATQLNRYCKERGIVTKPVDEQSTLAHCVLFCTLWIPYLNILTGMIFLVIFFIVWKSVAETVASIITTKTKTVTLVDTITRPPNTPSLADF